MSGSLGAFLQTYGPLANQAGSTLGVSPSVILGQWGLESGYGTNSASTGYNVASIMQGGQPVAYPSAQAFEQAYVNTIQSAFPGAVGTGSNVGAFAGGLGSGVFGSYFGNGLTAAQYAAGISGAENALAASASLPGGGSATPAPATAAGTSGCGIMTGGLFTWSCWSGIVADAAMVAIGGIMIFAAVTSGLGGKSTNVNNVISVAKLAAAE